MDEYRHIGDQIREALIDEYLQKNPGIARAQVITRMVNGRVVCDTITQVLATVSARKITQQEQELIKKQLEVQEDDRYQEGKISVQTSKRIVDFLFTSSFPGFGLNEKNENLNFLRRHERILVDRAYAMHEVKKEFLQMMDGRMNPSSARTATLMQRYFQAILEQLKAQGAIYQKEYDLGSIFTGFARDFLKENVQAIKSKIKASVLKTIAQAYTLAKKATDANLPDINTIDRDLLEAALAEMDEGLDKRRIQIQAIEKVIAFVEKLVKDIQEQEKKLARGEPLAPLPQDDPEAAKKSKRMTFAMKLFGGKNE